MIRRPPRSPLFPYPPLSRSVVTAGRAVTRRRARHREDLGIPARVERRRAGQLDGTAPAAVPLTGHERLVAGRTVGVVTADRKSTRLNSSHTVISYAVFCLKK